VGQRENLPIELEDEENFFITRTSLIDHSIDLGPEAQLYRQKAYASSVVWQSPIDQLRELRCQAQFGPRPQNAASCGVFLFENQTIHVLFDQPQRVLVRGQMIAFYDGNALLGHAWIDKVDEE
jgi:tRNA U34 2-thiouridine synthase MnmA/TrmU